ncbi:hypothetical protein [Luteithermobacter gelatinilyticus]|uniref:hypothetical protein n=1 Tax=Luteithermobacter gelatinilyticus TaxID=2582913 RepID=UPI001106BD27|nr:hypothetical protein [Luteithermobacter gelatinilyticus]
MGDRKFSPRVKALLDRAHKVVEVEARHYPRRLAAQLDEMQVCLSAGNVEEALLLTYKVESEAAMLGWPLVTNLAGMLRRHLEAQGRFTAASQAALDSLGLMLKGEMAGQAQEARLLLKNLQVAMLKERNEDQGRL